MKANEMTNEELAKLISEGCGTSPMGHAIREAAKRLCNVTVLSDNSKVIAELERRLKVAEDALEAIAYEGIDYYSVVADAALAAIRGEGGVA